MITIRQIEKQWAARDYTRLLQQLMQGRIESTPAVLKELANPLGVAAMGVIRLDELSQSYLPVFHKLMAFILAGQKPDGSFGSPYITAVCARALLTHQPSRNDSAAKAIDHLLSTLDHGPDIPTKAFILHQLSRDPDFRSRLRQNATDCSTSNYSLSKSLFATPD